jgi:hypothetical protein
MCFFKSPKTDNTIQLQQQQEAEEARAREAERQARIAAGTDKINETFSVFDDAFFGQRKDAYLGYYQPQLDDQFNSAKEDLTFALARAGTLNSSMAGEKQADLLNRYDVERAGLLSQADNENAAARSRFQNEKSALVSQLNATGDADRVSNEALARTQQLFQERPAYNPLGDIFSGAAGAVGNFMQGRQAGQTVNAYTGSAPSARGSTTRTVN